MNKEELALKVLEFIVSGDYSTPCFFNTKFGTLLIDKNNAGFTTYTYIYLNDLPDKFSKYNGE